MKSGARSADRKRVQNVIHSVLPTRMYQLFGNTVTVLAFGRPTNYRKLAENPTAIDIITAYAAYYKVTDIFAPKCTEMNALVINSDPTLFTESMVERRGVRIHSGAVVDAVRLEKPNTAFFLATADCPTFITRFPDQSVAAAHCARDSLINPKEIRGEKPDRYFSVVQALFDAFGRPLSESQMALVCGIGPLSFDHAEDHPQHGPLNAKRNAYLSEFYGPQVIARRLDGCACLDLFEIVRFQVGTWFTPTIGKRFRYDGIDTYADTDSNGFIWHSNKRGDTETRNGILVIRHV